MCSGMDVRHVPLSPVATLTYHSLGDCLNSWRLADAFCVMYARPASLDQFFIAIESCMFLRKRAFMVFSCKYWCYEPRVHSFIISVSRHCGSFLVIVFSRGSLGFMSTQNIRILPGDQSAWYSIDIATLFALHPIVTCTCTVWVTTGK